MHWSQLVSHWIQCLVVACCISMKMIMATFAWNMEQKNNSFLFAGLKRHDHASVYVRFTIMWSWDGCLASEWRQCEQFKKHNLKSFPLSFWGPGRFCCQATLGKSFQLIHLELDGLYCRLAQPRWLTSYTVCCGCECYTKNISSRAFCAEMKHNCLVQFPLSSI